MTFKNQLRTQAALHPTMQPQDVLKMCYQAAFGAEHLLVSEQAARDFLTHEWENTPGDSDEALYERISNEVCRLNIRAWKGQNLPMEWMLQLFLLSCKPLHNAQNRFFAFLGSVDALCAADGLPFGTEEWKAAKENYLREGVRPVHHSDSYRTAEKPAYRVMDTSFLRLLPLLLAVHTAKAKGGAKVIAIDGRAAGGKSTLARQFQQVTGAGVIHMDDFFLPADMRTEERLATPGGNVHYERFAQEVLPHLAAIDAFSYTRFDCSVMAMGSEVQVPAGDLRLVEGSYCCHPALGDYMDLRVFSDVTPREQLRRVQARDNAWLSQMYVETWIPLEEKYFKAYAIRDRADLTL